MKNPCHDCGAKPGEFHKPNCDVERCPFCGGQLISCNCVYRMLGKEFGWTYKPENVKSNRRSSSDLVIPLDYTVSNPLGDGRTMFSHPTDGLPEKVYNEGLTPEMQKRWEEYLDKEGKLPWTGEWPGEAECVEYGFYSYFGPVPKGEGGAGRWVSCAKDHPDAGPDLNRLMTECVWSRKLKKFVLKPKQQEEEPAR